MKQRESNGHILLPYLPPGQTARIGEVTGSPSSVGRMAAIGISRGADIRMIRNTRWLPLIIEVRDTFLAMGRAEAVKICVKKRTP